MAVCVVGCGSTSCRPWRWIMSGIRLLAASAASAVVLIAGVVFAQPSTPGLKITYTHQFATAPTGACTPNGQLAIARDDGCSYACSSGTWALVSCGGGGGGPGATGATGPTGATGSTGVT